MLRNPPRIRQKLRRAVRQSKNGMDSLAVRVGVGTVARLPLDRALSFGSALGAVAYHVCGERRRRAVQHIAAAFGGGLSARACRRLARAAFVNAARTWCELAVIDEVRARAGEYFEIEGAEHLEQARRQNKGVLLVTGQMGNWELLNAYCSWRGFPVGTVARRAYTQLLDRVLDEFRRRQGVRSIRRENPGAEREILEILSKNGLLTMLVDADASAPGASIPFFGPLARLPAAAATLAVRRGVPVVPAFIQRKSQGGHRVSVRPPLYGTGSGDAQGEIRTLARKLGEALEEQILRNPAEWIWWHRPWRGRAVAELDLPESFPYTAENHMRRSRSGSAGEA